jgi:hypothetical protein
MDLYMLDSLYRRTETVEEFESLIWTERFSAKGDIELHIASTLQNRTRFQEGVLLSQPDSYRVMRVETIEDKTDEENRRMLTIKGSSLEYILEKRAALAALSDLVTDPKWVLTGLPKDIAEQMFHDICVTGILDAGDIITGIVEGSDLFPADTIDAPSDSIEYSIDPQSLYTALKSLCDAYAMGFRIVKHPVTSVLYFDVYMGCDRTTAQTDLAAVVFSPDLDNLKDTTKLSTDALYANAAYVISQVGAEIVYPVDVDPSVEGFERRVLLVKADDIDDPDGPTASAQMIQRGREALSAARKYIALDGELAPTTSYVYGTDYNLGDLVELRDDDGATSYVQVTEQIFTSDTNGDRSFPTLSLNTFVTTGSWLSMGLTEWADMTTEEWADMP